MKMPGDKRQPWLDRRAIAWSGYDLASSVYVGVVPSVVAPLYIRELAGDFQSPTAVWGILASVAVLVSSLAALAAASLARRLSRFTLLAGLSVGLMAAMVALAWNPHASLARAALAFVAAQSFYFAATVIYESFLPDITPPAARQKLSGFGWAVGYLGGMAAIIVLLVLIAGRPQSIDVLAHCFAALAVIGVAAFAIVLPIMRREGFAELAGHGGAPELGGVLATIRQWRAHPGIFQLLLGAMLIQMGIFVVVTFTAPILSDRFGQSLEDLLWLLLLIHVVAVPSTLVWSHLLAGASRIAATVLLLASWAAILLLLAFASGKWMPLATVLVIGCCLGATFAGLRGFLAESVGNANPVAFFALATAAGRIAAALGPALFSLVILAAGEQAALMAIFFVFVCGGGIILGYLRRESRMEEKPASRQIS